MFQLLMMYHLQTFKLSNFRLLFLLLLCDITQGQVPVSGPDSVTGPFPITRDTIPPKYSFIAADSSFIYNDSAALTSFFQKLKNLRENKTGTIHIVHIGDSHIQADVFSGKLRQDFQTTFGNSGRGLIFPYKVAKTNEPSSFKTSSNVAWQSKRNVFPDQPMPIGISGVTIETGDTSSELKLVVKDQGGLDYSFNKLTLFHAKNDENFDFAVYDSLYHEIGYVSTSAGSTNKFTSTLLFDKPYKQVMLKSCPRNTSQTCARIYGILLENSQPGVLYSMIGVNGAEFRHFNASVYFTEQLSALKPDLVIISMGTNEGFAASFDKEKFYSQIDSLVSSIKRSNPGAEFLLTTPGDSFRKSRKGRVKNPNMLIARNTIISYCKQNNLACWDLYAVMGGYGSMANWFKAGLTAKDKLHFNTRGYLIQADLMYAAILNSYLIFDKKHP